MTTTTSKLWLGIALTFSLTLTGCPGKKSGDGPAPSASAVAVAEPPSKDGGATDAKPAGGTATGKAASYSGTYTLTPATLHISDAKDYKGVKQAPDDPSKHVGEGALTLVVDAEGRVTGTVDSGPASPALIDGALVESEIRGFVRRKTPADDGLTGTLVAKVATDAVDGKMSLAESNAAILREGKLSLKKK